MRRIAILSHGGFGDPEGNQFTPALVNLVGELSEKSELTIYTPTAPRRGEKSFVPGKGRVTLVSIPPSRSAPSLFRSFLKAFRRDHLHTPFEIVHGFWSYPGGLSAVIIGRLYSLPSVVSLLGGEGADIRAIGYGHMGRPLLRSATLWTCRQAKALVALTRFQHDCLRSRGFKRPDVDIIPLGVPRSWLAPSLPRLPDQPPYNILHVGNLTEVKDQGTLFRCLRYIGERVPVKTRIAGPDYLNGALQRLACELGIENTVEFLGYVHPRDLVHQYRWAHFLLHTSLYEGQGVVIAEAAANGAVVCGTNVGLIHDLGDSCVGSSEVGDAKGLAEVVIRLLRNPGFFANLQNNAFAWSAAHTVNWTAEEYNLVYDRVLRRG